MVLFVILSIWRGGGEGFFGLIFDVILFCCDVFLREMDSERGYTFGKLVSSKLRENNTIIMKITDSS